ncbi:MAG: hypothetical protein GX316_11160 [Firmicutes bacterium]|nr:hypothetical protein [Bacillota bacterium]
MGTRQRWLLLGVAVFSFSLGFFFTVLLWPDAQKPSAPLDTNKQLAIKHSLEDQAVGQMPETDYSPSITSQVRLLPEAHLVEALVSDAGQIITTSTSLLPTALAGLTLDEVRNIHPDWRVLSFAPEKLTVKVPDITIESLYGHLSFLGIYDGKVAVFQGKPGIYEQVVHTTQIPVTSLPDFEVDNLKEGIPYSGEEELSVLLESFTEKE